MKKFRTWSALLLVLLMAVNLAACGGGGAEDPNAGKYLGDQINILGWMPITEIYSGDNYLELRSGGKGEFCLDGDPVKVKWKLEGEKLVVTAEGQDCTGTLIDGVVQLDTFFGMEMPMTFVKEGAVPPVFEEEDLLYDLYLEEEPAEEPLEEEPEEVPEETEAAAESADPANDFGKTTAEATGIMDFDALKAGYDWLRFETSRENDYGRPSYEEIREAMGGVDGMKTHADNWKSDWHVYVWQTENKKDFCLVGFKVAEDGTETWGSTSWSSSLSDS